MTLDAEREDASTLTGTWSVSLYPNDSSGYRANATFGGTFQVSKTSCSGDFYVITPLQIASQASIRTIALVPNLIVSYSTAKKL